MALRGPSNLFTESFNVQIFLKTFTRHVSLSWQVIKILTCNIRCSFSYVSHSCLQPNFLNLESEYLLKVKNLGQQADFNYDDIMALGLYSTMSWSDRKHWDKCYQCHILSWNITDTVFCSFLISLHPNHYITCGSNNIHDIRKE